MVAQGMWRSASRRLARILGHTRGGESQADDPEDEEDGEANSEDEDSEGDPEDEEGKEKGVPCVAQWFADCDQNYASFQSFHTLHVREDYKRILLRIRLDQLDIPFFNQLTYVGTEGGLPDMVDCTPSSAGFQFKWAPNGKDLQLVQMQQKLPPTDLAASLYDAGTGGALSGYLRVFKPLASDKVPAPEKEATSEHSEDVEAGQPRGGDGASGGQPPSSERSAAVGAGDGHASKKRASGKQRKAGKDAAGKKKKKKAAEKKEKPPPPLPGEEALLVDVTSWLSAFAVSAMSNRAMMSFSGQRPRSAADNEAHLTEARAFPQNFWLRYMVQRSGEGPVKTTGFDATAYYSVAFCRLPEVPMVPRAKDRRVGFFETPVSVGGARRVNEVSNVINRWNLARHGGQVRYYIDPEVPVLFHATIRRGVESWNGAFAAAGCGDRVLRCVAPGEEDFPSDYSRGDARYSAVYLTDSMMPVFGYGPSLTDFRSGEILVANILLGFSVFVEEASRHAAETLQEPFVRPTGGCRPPMLDADHPDVLDNMLFTVLHEVGHTLGLRHNFIAQEDGNSSVMMYPDTLDTLQDPCMPKFGGHFIFEPGRYDIFAIKYGYTPLEGEAVGQRHPALELLANGQEAADGALSASPGNPLFATDEDIGNEDPRVNLWNRSVDACGHDKVSFALEERHKLLELVRSGQIFPETFTDRIRLTYSVAYRHVMDARRLLGGSTLDPTRTRFRPCAASSAEEALRAAVDFCVGPVGRFTEEEAQYMMTAFPRSGYQVNRLYMLTMHKGNIRSLLQSLLSYRRLEKLEMQRALRQERAATRGPAADAGGTDTAAAAVALMPQGRSEVEGLGAPLLGTFEVLSALAFRPGRRAEGIFHPFLPLPAGRSEGEDAACWTVPSGQALSRAAADALRAEASLALARQVHELAHEPRAMALVRAGARAFIQQALEALRTGEQGSRGLDPVSQAHWAAVLEELTKPPEKRGREDAGFLPFLFFGDGTPGGMQCGHGRSLRQDARLQRDDFRQVRDRPPCTCQCSGCCGRSAPARARL